MRKSTSTKPRLAVNAGVVLRMLVVSMAAACSSNFDEFGSGGGRTNSTLDFGSTTNAFSGTGGQGGRASSDGGGVGGSATGGAATGGGSSGAATDAGMAGALAGGPRPTSITISPVPTSTTTQGPSAGGSPFIESCGANEVLVGYTGTVDSPDAGIDYLRSFQAVCGTLAISTTTPFTVTTSATESLTARGLPSPVSQMRMCGANEVIVGFTGRSGAYIDQLAFLCAPLIISGTSPNFTLSVGPIETMPVGIGGPGGAPFLSIPCPTGQVAMGDTGRGGNAIDQFGLLCAMPTLVVK